MGTMMTTNGVVQFSQASSAAILVLMGSRGWYDGRETIACDACGRTQFNKGQGHCIACRRTLNLLLEPLLPLPDSDAARSPGLPQKFGVRGRVCIRLRELRIALQISQRELGILAQCSRIWISKYERGTITPTLPGIERLARGLNITLGEIFDEGISTNQLAASSMLRSLDGDLSQALLMFVPNSSQNSRALVLQTAQRFSLAPHAR